MEDRIVVLVGICEAEVFSKTPTFPEVVPVQSSSEAHILSVSRSGLPSPFTSATTTDLGSLPPEGKVTGSANVPSPLFKCTLTCPGPSTVPPFGATVVTTRSGKSSPLMSAIATDNAAYPPAS